MEYTVGQGNPEEKQTLPTDVKNRPEIKKWKTLSNVVALIGVGSLFLSGAIVIWVLWMELAGSGAPLSIVESVIFIFGGTIFSVVVPTLVVQKVFLAMYNRRVAAASAEELRKMEEAKKLAAEEEEKALLAMLAAQTAKKEKE